MLSGSVPPRPSLAKHAQPPLQPATDGPIDSNAEARDRNAPQARIPVFGTKETLERLSMAYGGGLWPELGQWAPDKKASEEPVEGRRKRRKVEEHKPSTTHGCGVVLSP